MGGTQAIQGCHPQIANEALRGLTLRPVTLSWSRVTMRWLTCGSTCHNAPTHGESGHDTMGAVGAASHDDLLTWVEGSGTSVWPWGPGGVTGAALGALIISILAWTAPPTRCPQFAFWWSSLAAQTNFEILCQYGMDLDAAFAARPFSSLTVGSEFCPAAVLVPLCFCHPLWPRVHHWLTTSVHYPLEPLHKSD